MSRSTEARSVEREEPPVQAIMEARSITHCWPRKSVPVLDDIHLTLTSGTVTWVGGRNGVGKTTLLRMLAGILLPRQGTVRLEGLDPKADRKHYQRRLGFLSAGDRGLHARMRVEQHLDYWARLAYVPRSERPERVAAALEAFGLEPVVGQRVDRCSQGWRQRIRLAMAFLHDPDVILLDEPRNSLDDDGYAVLDAQVRGATARGGAVLWCSPRGEDRVITADQTFTLENGRLERTS